MYEININFTRKIVHFEKKKNQKNGVEKVKRRKREEKLIMSKNVSVTDRKDEKNLRMTENCGGKIENEGELLEKFGKNLRLKNDDSYLIFHFGNDIMSRTQHNHVDIVVAHAEKPKSDNDSPLGPFCVFLCDRRRNRTLTHDKTARTA